MENGEIDLDAFGLWPFARSAIGGLGGDEPPASAKYAFASQQGLGSNAGITFTRNSMRTLRPGGVAVHTTEFNLSSDTRTVDHESTVLFRRRDIERLARELQDEGCRAVAFNFDRGDGDLDRHVDVPPFSQQHHLRLALKQSVATSFGVIAVAPGGDS